MPPYIIKTKHYSSIRLAALAQIERVNHYLTFLSNHHQIPQSFSIPLVTYIAYDEEFTQQIKIIADPACNSLRVLSYPPEATFLPTVQFSSLLVLNVYSIKAFKDSPTARHIFPCHIGSMIQIMDQIGNNSQRRIPPEWRNSDFFNLSHQLSHLLRMNKALKCVY